MRRPRNSDSGDPSLPKKAKVGKNATKSPCKMKEPMSEASESGYGIGEDIPNYGSEKPRTDVVKRELSHELAVLSQDRDNENEA